MAFSWSSISVVLGFCDLASSNHAYYVSLGKGKSYTDYLFFPAS